MVAILCALFGGAFVYAYRQTAVAGRGVDVTQSKSPQANTGLANAQETSASVNAITVHVSGAVHAAGVYALPPGSRAVDAIMAAGGLSNDADQDSLNLAAPVADGDHIVVPGLGPPEAGPSGTARPSAGNSRSAPDKLKSPGDGTVNINSASATELQRLPGIGPAMAARIIEYRKEIGRFTAVEQLLDVSGIGEKKLARMKPFVRIR